MGIGPGVLALYVMMRREGLFDDVKRVIEIGAQVLVCHDHHESVLNIFEAFGVSQPKHSELMRLAQGAPARDLFGLLGIEYSCVDASGEYGALALDLNFDECPSEHRGQYNLVTNHGTTEHLLNQFNAFKVIHDLAAPGALIMHALPFTSYVDHGYFNYQPNLFLDLARANGYSLLGIWLNIDPKFTHFIPWERGLEKHIRLGTSDSLLLVLFRKTANADFSAPFQAVYEHLVPEATLKRYRYIVDGQQVSGRRGLFLSLEETIKRYYAIQQNDKPDADQFVRQLPGRILLRELQRRVFRRLVQRLLSLIGVRPS
jgi:hypothetical protein